MSLNIEKDLIIIKSGVSFEISSMAVVVTIKDKIPYFLVMKTGNRVIDFPKGHIKVNETYLEAAIREANEEVGIDLTKSQLLTEIDGFTYTFDHKTLKIDIIEFHDRFKAFQVKKQIHVFLFIVDDFLETKPNEDEFIEQTYWVTQSEMNHTLSYKNSKEIIPRVMAQLTKNKLIGT
ncbi:MAG TPA: NUDIX hydrolase [Acholeplasma sp.]|nr:NUDIX hydrolase [Acholeplasma sp.]